MAVCPRSAQLRCRGTCHEHRPHERPDRAALRAFGRTLGTADARHQLPAPHHAGAAAGLDVGLDQPDRSALPPGGPRGNHPGRGGLHPGALQARVWDQDVQRRRPTGKEWTSVYLASPDIPAPVLRGIARHAGVHLYSEDGDVLYATPELLSVHTVSGGKRTFRLPGQVEIVYDLFQ